MPFLLALFLVVHASIHIGYICGPAWPFVASDPWLVTGLGAGADIVRVIGITLVLVTFAAFVLAAVTVTGFVRSAWKPLVVVASVASVILLTIFVAPSTLPGIAIDAVLLWATLVRGWHPTRFVGRTRHPSPASQAAVR